MNKYQAKEYIDTHLEGDDVLIGFFQAVRPPYLWLALLVGPLFVLSMRIYFLAVTERGIAFHRLSMFGKFKDYDFFEYSEIESVKIGKGMLQRPMEFKFKNDRKLMVKAQLKGVAKVAKLSPEVQRHIEQNISLAR